MHPPSAAGNAPWRAIESAVRDAGRIVVWVEASAEVMIASTTIQSEAVAEHVGRQRAEEAGVVLELGDAVEPGERDHRGRRRDVGDQQHDRADDRGQARRACRSPRSPRSG